MIKTAFELKTVGKILEEKRKEKNLTYEQVSEIIKISPEYLKALEESDYNRFPSEVYIKGFLKNYARFLGVEVDRAIALYRREKEKQTKNADIKSKGSVKHKSFDFTITRTKIIAGIAIVLVLVATIFFGNYISSIFQSPTLTLTNPVNLSSGENGSTQTSENSVSLEGSAEIGSKLTINGQEYRVNSFEQFVVGFDLTEGNNDINISLENQFGRTSQISLTIVKQKPTPTPTPKPEKEPTTGIMSVRIEVISSGAYIEATVDGELEAMSAFPVDEELNFEANSEFELFAPRPETINLFINGQLQTVDAARTKFILDGEKVTKVNL